MPYPTIWAGMNPDETTLQDLQIRTVSQGSSQSVNNTTTLVNSNIVIPVVANATYKYELWLAYSSANTTSEFKLGYSVPSGTTMARFQLGAGTSTTGTNNNAEFVVARYSDASNTTFGTDNGSLFAALEVGLIKTAGTAGNVTLRFAQSVASAVNTTLDSTTQIHYIRIS